MNTTIWILIIIIVIIKIIEGVSKKSSKYPRKSNWNKIFPFNSSTNPNWSDDKEDLSVYERKPYLFDTASEFNTYKILIELFGNDYFIFPQINYSHLIQPKNGTWGERQGYRNRIDRKSADFVFCDKEKIVPQLVIELDGCVHDFKSKQERDRFINELTKNVGLPILHLKTHNLGKEFLKSEITNKLNILWKK